MGYQRATQGPTAATGISRLLALLAPPPTPHQTYRNLDGLRLIASVGIVLFHYNIYLSHAIPYTRPFTQRFPYFVDLFFVISGMDLNLSVLPTVGLVGAIYIVVRVAGKWLGAAVGSRIVQAHPNVQKYLGLTLIPQAGVAIGMAQLALDRLPAYGHKIQAIVLAGTLIYELIGPVVTKLALTKAGEIGKAVAPVCPVPAAKES